MIEYWGNDRGATYIAGVTPQELISLMGEIKMICDNDTFMSTSGPINIIHCDSTELSRGFILQVDSNWFLLGPGR